MLTSKEKQDVQQLAMRAYEKGFNLGFETGYQKCIEAMEKLLKEKEKKEGDDNK